MSVKHQPDENTRELVADLTSFGNTHEEIAQVLRIDADTLKKHYPYELQTAAALRNGKVAKSLYRKAIEDNDTQSQIFWLKTRARWRTVDPEPAQLASQNTLPDLSQRTEAIANAEKEFS